MLFKPLIEGLSILSHLPPRLIRTFVVGKQQENDDISVTARRNRFCQEQK